MGIYLFKSAAFLLLILSSSIIFITKLYNTLAYQKKKTPREVRRLRNRLERARYIQEHSDMEEMDLLDAAEEHIADVEQTVKEYNDVLARADALRDKLESRVQQACDIHNRIRMLIVGKYGRDSREYLLLGGVLKSDIDYSRTGTEEE